MNELLFDTSAVLALVERASESAAQLVRDAGRRPWVSFITIAEIHVGMSLATSPEVAARRRRTYERALQFRQVPVDQALLEAYSTARSARIRGNDAWIAATALHLGTTLVTEDAEMATRAAGLIPVITLP